MAGKNESKVNSVQSLSEILPADAGERLEEAKSKPGRICQGKNGLTTDDWKLGSVTEHGSREMAAHGHGKQ